MSHYDVIIVGGGPGGTSAAISCQRAGLHALLIERKSFPRSHPGETFHPGLEPLFARLGVAEAVGGANFLRHAGTWITWDGSRQFEPFGADGTGPWYGFQAWRADFDSLLLHHAEELGVRIWQPCRPLHPLVEDGRVVGVVTTRDAVRARFVVDAAGGQHWIARHLRLELRSYSSPLVCWYGYTEGECPARDDAPAIVADQNGWTWTACVRPGLYAWTRLSFDSCRRDKNWLPQEFRSLQPRGKPRGADVTWRMVSPAAGLGYFLVGDAAAVLDPASSHGVLKAVMSGMLAAHIIATCKKHAMSESEAGAAYSGWITEWFQHDVKKLQEMYTIFPAWKEGDHESCRTLVK